MPKNWRAVGRGIGKSRRYLLRVRIYFEQDKRNPQYWLLQVSYPFDNKIMTLTTEEVIELRDLLNKRLPGYAASEDD